jgi:hypothetical protein
MPLYPYNERRCNGRSRPPCSRPPSQEYFSIFDELQDYMFTSENINRYTKHIIRQFQMPRASVSFFKQKPTTHDKTINAVPTNTVLNVVPTNAILNAVLNVVPTNTILNVVPTNAVPTNTVPTNTVPTNTILNAVPTNTVLTNAVPIKQPHHKKVDISAHIIVEQSMYCPKQKDSLFWCFYILKYGYFKYEMEICGKYFVVEREEKFKYIDIFRKNKEVFKLHKIKPYSELEDNLANEDRISIKTFFALCAVENINVMLIHRRKIYELLCTSDKVNVVHRENDSLKHSVECDTTAEIIQNYRNTYYIMENFDATLKSISAYKLDELFLLCQKLNINVKEYQTQHNIKKMTKKHVYDLLISQF